MMEFGRGLREAARAAPFSGQADRESVSGMMAHVNRPPLHVARRTPADTDA
jgi:hypothetical protein